MSITEKSPFEQYRRNWSSRLRSLQTDLCNKARFGANAPKFAERLWIPISELEYIAKIGNSKTSGHTVDRWPENCSKLDQSLSIRACLEHWQNGVSWEQTGIYTVMMEEIQRNGKVDRLRTFADVKSRYTQLDELFEKVCAMGRLSTREELNPGNFREEGGILINIGPDGRPYFGRKGNHRLAMAIAARLNFIPAQLGVIHVTSLSVLHQYRQSPKNQAIR